MPKLDEFMQIAEAAEYLGVCQNTLRNWGKAGKIREHRHPMNNYRLYRRIDLDELFEPVTDGASDARNVTTSTKEKNPR